jgi:hypothetical protein
VIRFPKNQLDSAKGSPRPHKGATNPFLPTPHVSHTTRYILSVLYHTRTVKVCKMVLSISVLICVPFLGWFVFRFPKSRLDSAKGAPRSQKEPPNPFLLTPHFSHTVRTYCFYRTCTVKVCKIAKPYDLYNFGPSMAP